MRKLWLVPLLLLPAAVAFHTDVQAGILTAGERCLCVLVPALYCYAIIAALCTRTGLAARGGMVGVVLFAQLGGYPVGAQLVAGLYRSGSLTRAEAQRLLCVCMGCGPGFVLGTVCAGMPLRCGLCMLAAVSLPNLVGALVLARGIHPEQKPLRMPGVQVFTESVEAGADAMLRICSMVLAMGALLGMSEGAGLFRLMDGRTAALLRTLLEVSCIVGWAAQGGSLPMAAALLAFGGICVHLQIAAICGELMPWRRFWGMRLVCSAAAYGLCAAGMRLLPGTAAVSLTAVPMPAVTENSLLPGLCLLVMTVLLLRRESMKK